MDDIMKSIHEHKLGVQNHIDNHNAELRGEDLTTLQKGKKLPVGTVSNGRKKVAEGKWTTVNESTGTSKLQDSERMNSVNSMWSKFDKEFKSKNLHSKTLNMPNEKVAKQFKEDFKASNFKDKYSLKENPTNKLSISITKKYADKSIEEDVDLQKGAMTAGNIYAKNPKHEVKKKIDKMFDPETEEDEDEVKKESNPCWDGYEMAGMKDKNGKKVPNCVPKKGAAKKGYIEKNHGSGCGIKKGQLVIEEADRLSKGKKMPIGTVSNGRKKVAEGKWVDVKDSKGKSNKEASEKKEGSGEKKSSKMTSNIPDTISELTGGSAVDKVEVKNGKQMERIVDLDNKNTKPYYKVYDKKSKKVLASTNEYSDAYDVLNEKKSGGDKKFVSASDSIKSDMKGKSQQERVFAAVERIKKIAGKTGVGKVDKDSGMVKTFSRIYGIKEDKMLKLIQEHGKGTNSKPKSDTSDPSMSAEGKVMTVGAIKQFKEFQKEYNKVEDSKKKAYISDLKSKMERIVEAGAHQNSVYGADLFTAAQKLVKENGGGLVSSYKKKPKITDPRPDKNKSIEEDIDLTKAISDFDSLIKGGSDNRDKALMKKLGLEGYNKPKRTPNHPTKSHVVFAKEGNVTELIRFGEQGAKTAGSPKEGESAKMKKKRASFKARHGKNIARGKLSAAHWADKVKW